MFLENVLGKLLEMLYMVDFCANISKYLERKNRNKLKVVKEWEPSPEIC